MPPRYARPSVRSYVLSSQLDPVRFATRYLRLALDPWQQHAVSPCHRRGVLNCSRQSGKTTALAVRALHHLLFYRHASVLIVAHSENQAGLTVSKILAFCRQLGEPVRRLPGRRYDYELLRTGGILRALPCREAAVRGYTANLVLVDEAALVPDSVYDALTGTLASTWDSASLWLASTPRGRRGFFYRTWIGPAADGFLRLEVPASDCPRISAAFLARQREVLTPSAFAQDYECRFAESELAWFPDADIAALANDPTLVPISPHRIEVLGRAPLHRFKAGFDQGQSLDPSAFCLVQHAPLYLGQNAVSRRHEFQGRLVIRDIERLPLNTSYPDLIAWLRTRFAYPELQAAGVDLVIDATGANAFVDYLRQAQLGVTLIPVVITNGQESTYVNGRYHVPRLDLYATLQFLLRRRCLKLAPGAGHVEELKEELSGIRRLVTPGRPDLVVTPAGQHDDLVCATALAAWWGLHQHKGSLLQEVA